MTHQRNLLPKSPVRSVNKPEGSSSKPSNTHSSLTTTPFPPSSQPLSWRAWISPPPPFENVNSHLAAPVYSLTQPAGHSLPITAAPPTPLRAQPAQNAPALLVAPPVKSGTAEQLFPTWDPTWPASMLVSSYPLHFCGLPSVS